MEVGFSINREKKVSLEAPLAEAGPLFWNDTHFDNRMAENKSVAAQFWTEEAIKELHISQIKSDILRKCNKMFVYMSANIPYGKPLEEPKLSAAARSINDLLLMAQNLALSDTRDEDCTITANDYFSRCHDIAWHTFSTETNVVNKSFMLPPNPMLGLRRDEGENMTEDEKQMRLWWEQHKDELMSKKG